MYLVNMKKLLLVISFVIFGLTGCVSYSYGQDDMYVNEQTMTRTDTIVKGDTVYIVRDSQTITQIEEYGTPYYSGSTIAFYVWNDIYYYPYWINGVRYYRWVYRPYYPLYRYRVGVPYHHRYGPYRDGYRYGRSHYDRRPIYRGNQPNNGRHDVRPNNPQPRPNGSSVRPGSSQQRQNGSFSRPSGSSRPSGGFSRPSSGSRPSSVGTRSMGTRSGGSGGFSRGGRR